MMNSRMVWAKRLTLATMVVPALFLTACPGQGGGGSKPYENHDFGDNDPNLAVAIGDSVVEGYSCDTETLDFPARIAQMTGMSVVNLGQSSESSGPCAARTPGVLDDFKPGFLLILTTHNDAIHERDADEVANNLRAMIHAAKDRKVVPIVATPVPISGPRVWATGPAEDYTVAIRALTSEEGVPLVDLEREFGEDSASLQCDGLHLNDEGSVIAAAAFADKLP